MFHEHAPWTRPSSARDGSRLAGQVLTQGRFFRQEPLLPSTLPGIRPPGLRSARTQPRTAALARPLRPTRAVRRGIYDRWTCRSDDDEGADEQHCAVRARLRVAGCLHSLNRLTPHLCLTHAPEFPSLCAAFPYSPGSCALPHCRSASLTFPLGYRTDLPAFLLSYTSRF
ncbi:hypothetical protein PLICRDRAFT_412717 [Plicaturopsis crispa FD-325 SS-3]|nr:hypothetical protein PLICRDRAFT_412717 [Plicaturopsis crispa FD-325 SS-3]